MYLKLFYRNINALIIFLTENPMKASRVQPVYDHWKWPFIVLSVFMSLVLLGDIYLFYIHLLNTYMYYCFIMQCFILVIILLCYNCFVIYIYNKWPFLFFSIVSCCYFISFHSIAFWVKLSTSLTGFYK